MLTYEVFLFLTSWAPVIRATLGLHDFQVVGIRELTGRDELDRNYESQVIVQYAYEYNWLLQQSQTPLRDVSLVPTVELDVVTT